jgi:hypothetical protein
MRGLPTALLITIGVLAVLLGVWWILQGTGIVPVGFKAHHMQWAWRGIGLAAGGAFVVMLSRRL